MHSNIRLLGITLQLILIELKLIPEVRRQLPPISRPSFQSVLEPANKVLLFRGISGLDSTHSGGEITAINDREQALIGSKTITTQILQISMDFLWNVYGFFHYSYISTQILQICVDFL